MRSIGIILLGVLVLVGAGSQASLAKVTPPATPVKVTKNPPRGVAVVLAKVVRVRNQTWQCQRALGRPLTHSSFSDQRIVSAPYARWLLSLWRDRHQSCHDHKKHFMLRDHKWWRKAVREAQRPYPGTTSWLMSCSRSEGGWGRWVPNSQGAGPGGWLQFKEGTFWRMYRAAHSDVRQRGYIVPKSAASWYSELGQALAGAWGVTHGRSHEWAGSGCR